jgi:hypothetical protein
VDWSGVVCVGCDQLSVRKAHHYVGVFCDLIGKRVLFATPGKDAATWGAFVTALSEHNGPPRTITEVSIEMGPAYIARVRENLGAQAARYAGLLKSNLTSVKAPQMRRILQAIYAIPDVALARRKRRAWRRWVRWTAAKHTPALFAARAKTARLIERHIEASWRTGYAKRPTPSSKPSTASSPPSSARPAASAPSRTSSPGSTSPPVASTCPLPSENSEEPSKNPTGSSRTGMSPELRGLQPVGLGTRRRRASGWIGLVR